MAFYNKNHRSVVFPVIFGLYFGTWYAFVFYSERMSEGGVPALVSWAAFGFSYGVLNYFILDVAHRIWVRWATGNWRSSLTATEQVRELTLRVPYRLVFSECESAMFIAEPKRKMESDFEGGKIHAVVPPRLLKWGRETVDFEIEKLGGRLTKVRIRSRPLGRLPIFDYASNVKRIKKLEAHLKSIDMPLEIADRDLYLTQGI